MQRMLSSSLTGCFGSTPSSHSTLLLLLPLSFSSPLLPPLPHCKTLALLGTQIRSLLDDLIYFILSPPAAEWPILLKDHVTPLLKKVLPTLLRTAKVLRRPSKPYRPYPVNSDSLSLSLTNYPQPHSIHRPPWGSYNRRQAPTSEVLPVVPSAWMLFLQILAVCSLTSFLLKKHLSEVSFDHPSYKFSSPLSSPYILYSSFHFNVFFLVLLMSIFYKLNCLQSPSLMTK